MLGLLLIICVAGAAEPYTMTLTSSKADWELVANGEDEATISALVVNTSTGVVANAVVDFSVIVPSYGSMVTTTATTDAAGVARSNFRVNTKSGTAEIFANMTYVDAWGATHYKGATLWQKIDHDSPYVPFYTLNTSSTVKFMEPVKITFYDIWGNRIDANNTADEHKVTLHIHGPSPDDCGFIVGSTYPHDIAMILDAEGNITPLVSLSSMPGANNILLDRFGSIPDKMKSIVAVSNGIPFSIAQSFDPDVIAPSPYPAVVADGSSKFTIQYVLYDQYGNPTSDQFLNLTTSAPEYYEDRKTSTNGDVWYTYGPKSFTGLYTLTATAVNNKSVTISKVVRFYNASPSNIEAYASPQVFASRDANKDIYSNITAKVVDDAGNPVSGESVSFTIQGVAYDPATVGYKEVPSFSKTSIETTATAFTDGDGIALVKFYPTNFSIGGEVNYEPSATGTGTVTATWSGIQRHVDLTWKNYPYLSAKMDISPAQIKAGDTVDVHLKLTGDGWALTSKPVDVVLVTDRSGSMLYDNPDRMHSIRQATKTFVDQMKTSDRVGLVSFGRSGTINTPGEMSGLTGYINNVYSTPKTYSDYGTLDKSLTYYSGFSAVKTEINNIVPDYGTPMRKGLKEALDHMIANPRSDTVRAVVLLSDGDYNWYGDPLARGTGTYDGATDYGDLTSYYRIFSSITVPAQQNLSAYAVANNIRIYTIAYGSSLSSGGKGTLQKLAETSGGKYYEASSSDIEDVYKKIAGDLRESAGVDTVAVMDFGTIIVNNNVVSYPDQTFLYVADPTTDGIKQLPIGAIPPTKSGSTWIAKYNSTDYLNVTPDYIGPIVKNMTGEWNAADPHQLTFNIGSVKLNEVWETNFRLRVLKEGSIYMMGPGSYISFKDVNGVASTMKLENLSSFTSSQNVVLTGATWETLSITDLRRTDTNPAGDLTSELPITWTTTYTGLRPVTHDVSFIHDNDPPVRFDQKITYGGGTRTLYTELDLSKLPPGGYQIRVHAYTDDANDIESIGPWSYNVQRRPFIMVE